MKKQSREPLSFMEALEAELRKEIRAEFEQENAGASSQSASPTQDIASSSAHERFELWLNARVAPRTHETPRTAAFGGYRSQAKIKSEHVGSSEKVSARIRVTEAVAQAVAAAHEFVTTASAAKHIAHNLDVMDIAALEFFRRNGVALSEGFDESELKSAYRKLALKFHPDRHTSASERQRGELSVQFTQATEQAKRLARHLQPQQAAA
jgi:hypothetical protein